MVQLQCQWPCTSKYWSKHSLDLCLQINKWWPAEGSAACSCSRPGGYGELAATPLANSQASSTSHTCPPNFRDGNQPVLSIVHTATAKGRFCSLSLLADSYIPITIVWGVRSMPPMPPGWMCIQHQQSSITSPVVATPAEYRLCWHLGLLTSCALTPSPPTLDLCLVPAKNTECLKSSI